MKSAVTREEFEALQKRDDEIPGGDHCYCCEFMALVDRLLTERDEAIGEVERLRTEIETKPISYTGQVTKLINEHERIKAELERLRAEASEDLARHLIQADATIMAEKRRTAAYRETALRLWSGFGRREKQGAYEVDSEAQKLLAPSDSGGEKIELRGEDNACGASFHREDINCQSTCGRKKGHKGKHSWFHDGHSTPQGR